MSAPCHLCHRRPTGPVSKPLIRYDRACERGLIANSCRSGDIGITTDSNSNLSLACLVLLLMAARQDCQP